MIYNYSYFNQSKVDERMHREMLSTVPIYGNDSAVTNVSYCLTMKLFTFYNVLILLL